MRSFASGLYLKRVQSVVVKSRSKLIMDYFFCSLELYQVYIWLESHALTYTSISRNARHTGHHIVGPLR